jgi:hypothetical protein
VVTALTEAPMTAPRCRWSFSLRTLFAAVGIGFAVSAAGQQDDVEEHIKALINQLASRDKDVRNPDRAPSNAHEADRQSKQAWQELRGIGPSVFPYLLEQINDQRYGGLLVDSDLKRAKATVGHVCIDMVSDYLQPYGTLARRAPGQRSSKPVFRPCYADHWLGDQQSAKEWWASHKDMTLAELQVEVLEWIIAEEAKTPGNYPDIEGVFLRERLSAIRSTGMPQGSIVGIIKEWWPAAKAPKSPPTIQADRP